MLNLIGTVEYHMLSAAFDSVPSRREHLDTTIVAIQAAQGTVAATVRLVSPIVITRPVLPEVSRT